jgi:hypothetical protein
MNPHVHPAFTDSLGMIESIFQPPARTFRTTAEVAADMIFGSDREPGYLNELCNMVQGQDGEPSYIDQICTLLAGKPSVEDLNRANMLLFALSKKACLLQGIVETWHRNAATSASRDCPVVQHVRGIIPGSEIDAMNPLIRKVPA